MSGAERLGFSAFFSLLYFAAVLTGSYFIVGRVNVGDAASFTVIFGVGVWVGLGVRRRPA